MVNRSAGTPMASMYAFVSSRATKMRLNGGFSHRPWKS